MHIDLVGHQNVPDKARVWRPPAATFTILTPVLNVTKQGGADRVSSLDVELSDPCLDVEEEVTFLRFIPSSAAPRFSLDFEI